MFYFLKMFVLKIISKDYKPLIAPITANKTKYVISTHK